MNDDRIVDLVEKLKCVLKSEGVDPQNGLPEALFLFASSITPIPNVDLFVTSDKNRYLLAWRNDQYYGKGWHIPGGCIRLRETLENRIQKTAIEELGTEVVYEKKPIMTVESIATEQRIVKQGNFNRSHNICILYECSVPSQYDIEDFNKKLKKGDQGRLKWFDYFPENFLSCQRPMYEGFLKRWLEKNRI